MTEELKKKRLRSIGKRDYPVLPLNDALDIANAVKSAGAGVDGSVKRELVASELNQSPTSSWFQKRIGSALRWGLIEGFGELSLSAIGKKYYYPEKGESDKIESKRLAFLSVPAFKEIYDKYQQELPNKNTLTNYLILNKKTSERDASDVADLIIENTKQLFSDIIPLNEPLIENKKDVESYENKTTTRKLIISSPFENYEWDYSTMSNAKWAIAEAALKAMKENWVEMLKEKKEG